MSWISNLYTELAELVTAMAGKLNTLNANKEDKANKQNNLSSTNASHYPNVPAVNDGLINTLQTAQTYTDTKIGQNNANFIPVAQKGANNGVATLDATGKVPTNQMPALAITETFVVATQAAMLALTAQTGDVAVRTDVNKTFILKTEPASVLANWTEMLMPASGVQSVAMTVPTGYAVSGSPITNSGTLALSYATGYQGYTTAEANKLAGVAANANNYVLPTATSIVKGGVEIFSDTVQAVAASAVSATAARSYGVQLNAAGQMVVNVPWTDVNTTYTAGTLPIINAATSTTDQLWSAKVLNDWGDGKYTKAADMGDPTVAIPDWSTALQTQTPGI